jgi:branched-chain amino acid transport system ATP-binding protein
VEILTTQNLSKRFGGLVAVNDVSLKVREGRLTSLIGPNGAGKTTLFNLLTGLMKPDAGRIHFRQVDITAYPPHRIVKEGVARSFQIVNIFGELTLLENVRVAVQVQKGHGLEMFASVNSSSFHEVNEEAAAIVKATGLGGKERIIAKNLSYGDKRILEIAIALASKPRLLLMDEPTSGLASRETAKMKEFIQNLAKELTILLIEHDMNIVLSISDHIAVLHQGRVIAEGGPDAIRQNADVQEAYLGGL